MQTRNGYILEFVFHVKEEGSSSMVGNRQRKCILYTFASDYSHCGPSLNVDLGYRPGLLTVATVATMLQAMTNLHYTLLQLRLTLQQRDFLLCAILGAEVAS